VLLRLVEMSINTHRWWLEGGHVGSLTRIEVRLEAGSLVVAQDCKSRRRGHAGGSCNNNNNNNNDTIRFGLEFSSQQ
jgi:hypothetical protein